MTKKRTSGPRCVACRRAVVFDPPPPGKGWNKAWGPCPIQPSNLAIRCAYCFKVFCVKCSLPHFAIENEERMVGKVARQVAREVRADKQRASKARRS